MNAMLAEIGCGFADPVHGAQQVFRAVLEAMSRPGRIQTLPAAALDGLDAPGPGRGLTAVLLGLLDGQTSVWIAGALRSDAVIGRLRFHTGVRFADGAAQAAFVVSDAAHAEASLWTTLSRGSDEAPQDGATLIVEVPSFEHGSLLALRGPGIEQAQPLRVGGLEAAFWRARQAVQADFPRGVDLLLVCGERIAALPRSTRVSLED